MSTTRPNMREKEPADDPRPVGLGKGLAHIPDSFFDPLPKEILDLFEGRSES